MMDTVGVIKICSLVFHELLSLGCINFKNLGAHHQEEVSKTPPTCEVWMILGQVASYGHFKNIKVSQNNFD